MIGDKNSAPARIETLDDAPEELRSKLSDLAPSAMGIVLTLLGQGALGTAVSRVVPNQRIDRIAVFTAQLNETVRQLQFELETIAAQITAGEAAERVELLRQGAENAQHATSENRARRLARIVAHGISQDEIAAQKARAILEAFTALTDVEVSVLLYFYRNRAPHRGDIERLSIAEQLSRDPTVAAVFEKDVAFWIATVSRLAGAGLIRKSTIWGGRWGDDEWADEKLETAEFSPNHYALSTLGRLIAEYVVAPAHEDAG